MIMLKQLIHLSLAGSLLLTACEVPINYEQSTQDSSEEPAETQESTDMEWSTYTSEEYSFSVNFPSTWTVEEDTHGRPYVFFTSPERAEAGQEDDPVMIDARIIVYAGSEDLPNNDDRLSFETWTETENTYFDGEPTETTVDGFSGYFMKSKGFANIESEFIMVEHDGRVYELNFNVPDANDYAEEREHMLDSFQFLDSSPSETSSTSSSACNDEACFVENFKTCKTATMSEDGGFAAVAYEILGPSNEGCEVEMKFTKNPNPAWVNQPIMCTLDMDADFLTAWQKEFEAAIEGKGSCTGPLVEILQN